MSKFLEVAAQFTPRGQVLEVREYGQGNVNDTFLVTVGSGDHTLSKLSADAPPHPNPLPQGGEGKIEERFILQRLNTRVFPRPDLIMGNLRVLTAHVQARLEREPPAPGRGWEAPRVLLTKDGRDHFLDPEGSFWRALSFIEKADTLDTIKDLAHAREVGYALGRFHNLLSDLPPERLADTLPGFHITPRYLEHYDGVLAKNRGRKAPEGEFCLRFVAARRAWARVLEDAKAQGRLRLRPMHGDPKVNNVMLDTASGQAVGLVDLDTVKPGLVHYDIGDLIRSGGNPLGEETVQWEAARCEPELCRAILQGYLSQARDFLTAADQDYLFDAIRLLPFELGLRFFTDYLEGNVYFKARHRDHNLARALVQFKLTESIESQESAMRAIIRDSF